MRTTRLRLALAVLLWAPSVASAQSPAGWVQAEGFYHKVTNDYGDWYGGALHAVVPQGRNIWYGDVLAQRAFEDDGLWLSAANRHAFGTDWFTFVSAGAGSGDYFFPDLRLDAQVGKAWLARRSLVTSLGGMYARSKSVYEDVAITGSVAYYLPGVTIEGGGRVNWSSPGSIATGRGYGAVTVGRERKRLVTLRVAGGYEGYQLTGDVATERKFQSGEASLSWREWLKGPVGIFGRLDWYDNPFYTRTGVTLGLFRHW